MAMNYEQKKLFLQLLVENRNYFYTRNGVPNPTISKSTRVDIWKEIYAILSRESGYQKDFAYLRDIIWPNFRKRTLRKFREMACPDKQKTLDEFDQMTLEVLQIEPNDLLQRNILNLLESGDVDGDCTIEDDNIIQRELMNGSLDTTNQQRASQISEEAATSYHLPSNVRGTLSSFISFDQSLNVDKSKTTAFGLPSRKRKYSLSSSCDFNPTITPDTESENLKLKLLTLQCELTAVKTYKKRLEAKILENQLQIPTSAVTSPLYRS